MKSAKAVSNCNRILRRKKWSLQRRSFDRTCDQGMQLFILAQSEACYRCKATIGQLEIHNLVNLIYIDCSLFNSTKRQAADKHANRYKLLALSNRIKEKLQTTGMKIYIYIYITFLVDFIAQK